MMQGLVISCEHASPRIPNAYAPLFRSRAAQEALQTHRGFDPGALAVARSLGAALGVPVYAVQVSRLLIEINRSLGHPSLFSRFSASLSPSDKQRLVARYYLPHRERVERAVAHELSRHRAVLHLAVHSFTPVLDGEIRRADLGLLYDPKRGRERTLAERWQRSLAARAPELRVRRNYPYHGASDGFTTALRRTFGPRYLGFELEINQALITSSRSMRRRVASIVSDALAAVI